MKTQLAFFVLLIALISAQQIIAGPSPPFWGGNPVWKANVSFLYCNPVMRWNMTYYYNWNLKVQRYQHTGPQADQLCLAADNPYPKNDSCTTIYATDGWYYVTYPTHNWCCKCANSFGAVRYDWLQANSTFQGYQIINNVRAQHWTKPGTYLNHYYNTDDGLPVKFHQICSGNPKDWDFMMNTYTTKGVDDSLFKPPCSNLCTGVCEKLRKNAAVIEE